MQVLVACAWAGATQAQEPLAARAYGEPELWPYVRTMSGSVPEFGHSKLPSASLRPGYSDIGGTSAFGTVTRCVHRIPATECLTCPQSVDAYPRDWLMPETRYPAFQPGELVEHVCASDECEFQPLSLKADLPVAWYRLRDDALAVYGPANLLTLAMAGGASLSIRDHLDDDVRRDAAMHPERWGVGSDFLGVIGAAEFQVPVVLGVYALSLRWQDCELHDFSATLMSAFTINGLSTLLLKGVTDTSRPTTDFNGGRWGFPSYHSSSSFAIAGVVDEYYGHHVGFPAYVVAGLIGWSRIDERDHDLSDVVFGSVMGYVIGKSVAQHELTGDSRVRLIPWMPVQGGAGLGMQVSY